MNAATKVAASDVVLSKQAQWASEREIAANHLLRNGYRERFAFVGGRRFRVEAKYLGDAWWVEEVGEDGVAAADGASAIEFRLSDVRAKIADWVNEGVAE